MIHMIYFFTFLTFGLFDSPESTLITVYDKDCGYCQDLLHDTYKNNAVEDALGNFDHQFFEADEEDTKALMKEYGVVGFPTQILITKEKDTLFLEGYVTAKQQMSFLAFGSREYPGNGGGTEVIGGEAVKNLSEVASQMEGESISGGPKISDRGKDYICASIESGESFSEFLESVKKVIKKEGLKYKNIYKFVSDVSSDIICENIRSVHMRKKTSLFRYALDILNYKFIEDLIDHDSNGECNPNINYAQKETLEDGTEEYLMDFLDKIIDNYNAGGSCRIVHDISALKRVKGWLKSCHERDKNK